MKTKILIYPILTLAFSLVNSSFTLAAGVACGGGDDDALGKAHRKITKEHAAEILFQIGPDPKIQYFDHNKGTVEGSQVKKTSGMTITPPSFLVRPKGAAREDGRKFKGAGEQAPSCSVYLKGNIPNSVSKRIADSISPLFLRELKSHKEMGGHKREGRIVEILESKEFHITLEPILLHEPRYRDFCAREPSAIEFTKKLLARRLRLLEECTFRIKAYRPDYGVWGALEVEAIHEKKPELDNLLPRSPHISIVKERLPKGLSEDEQRKIREKFSRTNIFDYKGLTGLEFKFSTLCLEINKVRFASLETSEIREEWGI